MARKLLTRFIVAFQCDSYIKYGIDLGLAWNDAGIEPDHYIYTPSGTAGNFRR